MKPRHSSGLSRRDFLNALACTGTTALLGWHPSIAAAAVEPPPETSRLRLLITRTACWAPQYVAEPLLREEGFTDVQYIKVTGGKKYADTLRSGAVDINMSFSGREIHLLDQPDPPVKFLSGLHVGCYALVGSERVRSVRDLKGKTVWAGPYKQGGPHIFFSSIVAYVGLDPRTDINYAWVKKAEAQRLFREGKIDAFMSFPPEPQELMEKGIGHLLVDTNVDRPWSQYFCCMISGNQKFIQKNPVATKRAVRAILKGNDIVARNPELATDELIRRKIRKESERKYVLQALKDIPYGNWREYNPEDTVRFYALRLRDVGMIKTAPEEFITRHTDWRVIKSLKRELGMTWL